LIPEAKCPASNLPEAKPLAAGCAIEHPQVEGANKKRDRSGNPAGRPKGARSSETFLKALSEDFAANGIGVIEAVRQERPHEYLKIIATILPKQMQLEDLTPRKKAEDLTDDELASIAAGNA
jgi:hypothetical protein